MVRALWQGGEDLRNRQVLQAWGAQNYRPAAIRVARGGAGGLGGGGEEGDAGHAKGCGQVHRPGVVADGECGAAQYAGELEKIGFAGKADAADDMRQRLLA